MRRFILLAAWLVSLAAGAQHKEQPKFDPQKFQAALEQFITKQAGLTQKEAAAFFPVYQEMQKKQRALMHANGKRTQPVDEEGYKKAISERDEAELQVKKLQKQYHARFLKILPASKVFKVIKAEDDFHRQMFNRMRPNSPNKRPKK